MIYLGLEESEKCKQIAEYVTTHDISKVIIFSFEKCPLYMPDEVNGLYFYTGRDYNGDMLRTGAQLPAGSICVDYYGWDDIIMYRCFYPLLEEVGKTHLLVCNELLRAKSRKDLTYNCLHHYLQQTTHRMAFAYLPFRNEAEDFMKLVDQVRPHEFKLVKLADADLRGVQISGCDRTPSCDVVSVPIPEDAVQEYEAERDKLFDSLGRKKPETVPRQLQLWCGTKYKRATLEEGKTYYARNARIKLANVLPMTRIVDTVPEVYLLDCPPSREQLYDFLREVRPERLHILSTGLKVDEYYANDVQAMLEEVRALYATAGISADKRS